jgi:hypothetical protein
MRSYGNTPSINRDRVERFAQLLADGFRMGEAQVALGLSKGEASSTMRRIKLELGSQAQ